MKKVFSILMVAFAMTMMVACGEKVNGPDNSGGNNGGGDNPGGGGSSTAQTDTTIMSYTLMRSLVNIDWDVACNRVLAMGFTEIDPEELDDEDAENVRAFIKGNIMGDYYACYLRCDFPEIDNLVGAVVMHENHLNSSNQATCIENDVYFINDELRVLSDWNRDTVYCGGNIMWGNLQDNGQWDGPNETYYPHASSLEEFIAYLRALPEHNTITANWADSYLYNESRYTASCSAVINNQPYTRLTTNVITLAKENNLDK
jgi:hypothetical protein